MHFVGSDAEKHSFYIGILNFIRKRLIGGCSFLFCPYVFLQSMKQGFRIGAVDITAAEGAEGVPESVCRNKQTGRTR